MSTMAHSGTDLAAEAIVVRRERKWVLATGLHHLDRQPSEQQIWSTWTLDMCAKLELGRRPPPQKRGIAAGSSPRTDPNAKR
jgi:hypothetical protein